jgi:hypothetical protein
MGFYKHKHNLKAARAIGCRARVSPPCNKKTSTKFSYHQIVSREVVWEGKAKRRRGKRESKKGEAGHSHTLVIGGNRM